MLPGSGSASATRIIRRTAQPRLTAVGLAAAMWGAGLPERADEVVTLPGLQFGGGEHHGVAGGYPDGRRPAHAHLGDGGGGGPVIGDPNRYVLVGQERLIQEFQPAARPVDGANFVHKLVRSASVALCATLRSHLDEYESETGKK